MNSSSIGMIIRPAQSHLASKTKYLVAVKLDILAGLAIFEF